MEVMKRMNIVGVLVIAAIIFVALPAALAALDDHQKDITSHEGFQSFAKNVSARNPDVILDEKTFTALTGKIVVSNPILEEALNMHSKLHGVAQQNCAETCLLLPCFSSGCGCRDMSICYKGL